MTAQQLTLKVLSPIHRASRQVALAMESQCRELEVVPEEGHLITYLASYGPASVGEIRRVFGLKASTLTSMLDRLEDRGLLERTLNPEDRRSFLVDLLPKGRETASILRSQIEALEDDILGRLSDRDLLGFRAVVDAIATVTRISVREEPAR